MDHLKLKFKRIQLTHSRSQQPLARVTPGTQKQKRRDCPCCQAAQGPVGA